MLACERWTLTHSSGGAVVLPLAVPLALAVGLGSELGLVVMSTASAALAVLVVLAVLAVLVAVVLAVAVAVPPVAVAVAVLGAVAVAVALAVPVVVGVPDGDVEADCVGEAVRLGPPLTLTGGGNIPGGALAAAEWLTVGLLELVESDGEGDGVGDGDGDREGDGDGVGVGVLEGGRAWHTVSVLLTLSVIARGAACAVPSTPRVRKLPLSKVTAATLTCAKRIKNRLSTLLVRVTVCSS
jgi:hypothetical protein